MKYTATKRVGAFEAKTHLSQLLAEVSSGACVEITSRGKPVAVMISPSAAYADTSQLSSLMQTVREERPGVGISQEEIHGWKEEGQA
jgi:prevent-host-death family protein